MFYRLISRDVRRWESEHEPRVEPEREAAKAPEIIVNSEPKPSADVPKPKKQKKGKKK